MAAQPPRSADVNLPSGSQYLSEDASMSCLDSAAFPGDLDPCDSTELQLGQQHEYAASTYPLEETYEQVYTRSIPSTKPAEMLECGHLGATQASNVTSWSQERKDWQPGLKDARYARGRHQYPDEGFKSQRSPLLDSMSDLYGHVNTYVWPAVDLPIPDYNPFCGSSTVPTTLHESSNISSTTNDGQSLYNSARDTRATPLALQNTSHPTLLNGSAHEDNPSLKEPDSSLYSSFEYESMISNQSMAEQMLLPIANTQTLQSELFDPHILSHFTWNSNSSGLLPQNQVQDPYKISCIPPHNANMCLESIPVHDMPAQDASWSTSAATFVNKQASIPGNNTQNAQNPLAVSKQKSRKRARSPTPPTEHPDHANHNSLNSVDKSGRRLEICLYIDPITERERKRCKGQKRTRKVNGKVQRACFGCRFYNRKCDAPRDGPCSVCKTLTRRYMQQFSLPKFTCDSQTKFADIKLFCAPLTNFDRSYLADEKLLESQSQAEDVLKLVRQATFSLVPGVNYGPGINDLLAHYAIQILLIWKDAFIHFRPEAKIFMGILDRRYREAIQSFLVELDNTKLYHNKLRAAYILTLQYHSTLLLSDFGAVDLAAVEHIQCALQSRLVFLFGVLSTCNPEVKKLLQNSKSLDRALFPFMHKTDQSLRFVQPDGFSMATQRVGNPSFHLQCPILQTHEDSRRSTSKTSCFCSWALGWLPIVYLQYFGYDTGTFSQGLHDEGHVLYLLGRDVEARFQNLADGSGGLFLYGTDTLCFTAILSFFLYFGRLSLTDTPGGCALSITQHREYDLILHQVIFTAMELAGSFVESMRAIDNSEPHNFEVAPMANWVDRNGYERAMKDLFSDHINDITTKKSSYPCNDVPTRSIEAYRRKEE